MSNIIRSSTELDTLLDKQSSKNKDKNAADMKGAEPTLTDDTKTCLIGHTVLVMYLIEQTFGILSSQIVTGKTNIFTMNTMRYTVQVPFALVTAIVRGKSLCIEKKYISSVMIWGVSNMAAVSCFFFAASFFPVGNMEALDVISFICLSTLVDLATRNIRLQGVVASLFAIAGVILLVQPWNIAVEQHDVNSIPCDYWDNVSSLLPDSNNSNTSLASYKNQSLFLLARNLSDSTSVSINRTPDYFVYIDGKAYHIVISPLCLGYVLILSYSLTTTFLAYFIKDITTQVDPSPLLFWLGLLEGFCSLVITIIWSSINSVSLNMFPSGIFCLLFTCGYVICLGSTNIFFAFALGHFNVSKVAISKVVITVLLYISQRTWLKVFHPGHANATEICGTVTALCALLVTPVMEFWNKKCDGN